MQCTVILHSVTLSILSSATWTCIWKQDIISFGFFPLTPVKLCSDHRREAARYWYVQIVTRCEWLYHLDSTQKLHVNLAFLYYVYNRVGNWSRWFVVFLHNRRQGRFQPKNSRGPSAPSSPSPFSPFLETEKIPTSYGPTFEICH